MTASLLGQVDRLTLQGVKRAPTLSLPGEKDLTSQLTASISTCVCPGMKMQTSSMPDVCLKCLLELEGRISGVGKVIQVRTVL